MRRFSNTKKGSRKKRRGTVNCGNAVLSQISYESPSLSDSDVYGEAVFGEAVYVDLSQPLTKEEQQLFENLNRAQRELVETTLASPIMPEGLIPFRLRHKPPADQPRPPVNAEYLLYLFLPKAEREFAIGDLLEEYQLVLHRFRLKWRADLWFIKQVAGSLFPLVWRALVKTVALVWLGRILRRLIS